MISTAEDEDKEDDAGINLLLAVLDKDNEARSSSIVLDDLPWEKKPKQGGLLSTGPISGWSRKGAVMLPAGLATPGAVVITKLRPKKGSKDSLGLDYITTVLLKRWVPHRRRSALAGWMGQGTLPAGRGRSRQYCLYHVFWPLPVG